MNRYEKVNHGNFKLIVLFLSVLSFMACIGFGYLYYSNLKSRPLIDYPEYKLSAYNWTNNNIFVTVFNNKNIGSYSIDGGLTFQNENVFEISENGEYSLVVKDINGRLSNSVPVRINKIDKDAPVITFPEKTIVKLGEIFYPRSGVNISDGDGSGVVENYKIDPSTIDTSVEKTYQVTYTVLDNAGNVATKTRTVIVQK